MSRRSVAVVVEDDDDIRGLVADILRHTGFRVHEAATGLEALHAVQAHRPALITVDVGLPDIDGYELLHRIPQSSTAHVLLLTARAGQNEIQRGLAAGADDVLTKPFRPSQLRACLERVPRQGPLPPAGP